MGYFGDPLGTGFGSPLLGSSAAGGAAAGSSAGGLGAFGVVTAIAGAIMGAIGGFYSALNERNQLRSKALSADFEQSMASLNAKLAEQDAQSILEAGHQKIALTTLAYGQQAGALRAQIGAAGVEAGVGSAAEAVASAEYAKRVDMLTITKNAVREAGASRLRGAEERGRALLAGVSAANLRRSARSISPVSAAFSSLLNSASQSTGAIIGGLS